MSTPTTPPFFIYPAAAQLERVIPKAKFYEKASISRAVRELFIRQIDKIIWHAKLAPETLRLASTAAAPEIQIFCIHLKTTELHHGALRAIELAIPLPIVFELHHAQQTLKQLQQPE
jgi:hypothetical protein